MRQEIGFILKNFWPHRSKATGFAISNIAFKYRDKIESLPCSKFSNDRNLKSMVEESGQKTIEQFSVKRGHWANRDFSEYRQIA